MHPLASLFPTVDRLIGASPLARLQRIPGNSTNLYLAKLEGTHPRGSVKDRAAYGMIHGAELRGDIHQGDTLVEATSGNTGIALAMVAAMKGYRMVLVMPDNQSLERQHTLRAFGAELILTPASGGMELARDQAQAIALARPAKMLDQFSNPDNPLSHYKTTGPEIWEATQGKITHFVSAMGTTGTIMGTSRFLKEKNPDIRIIGVYPAEGAQIPGIRKWPEAYQPAFFAPQRVDNIIEVSQFAAETMTRRLAQEEGIFVGISSGGALWAALEATQGVKDAVVVHIACDRGDRYLSTGVFGAEILPLAQN